MNDEKLRTDSRQLRLRVPNRPNSFILYQWSTVRHNLRYSRLLFHFLSAKCGSGGGESSKLRKKASTSTSAHVSLSQYLEGRRGKEREEKRRRGKKREEERRRGKKREEEGRRGKKSEGEGRRGKEREGEGRRGKKSEGERSRGKEKEVKKMNASIE